MNKKKLRRIWYALTADQRYYVRKLYYLPIDLIDRVRMGKHRYVPPRGSIYTGSAAGPENFLAQGVHQLELLKKHAGLQPTHDLLDIGSGIGRTAIALTNYVDSSGSYEGFDVVKKGVEWCQSHIAKDHPNFNFTYVPLFNDLYNDSKLKAEDFKFPYQTGTFDIAFTFSVFTHMQIPEIQNYLSEIYRVLKPNGQALSTFFLYNDQNEEHISNNPRFSFPVKYDGHRLMSDKVKSGNIAIHQDKLSRMMEECKLTITEVEHGFWKGTENAEEYQDVVIFKKANS